MFGLPTGAIGANPIMSATPQLSPPHPVSAPPVSAPPVSNQAPRPAHDGALIAAKGLSVRHGGVAVLAGVDFTLAPGEIVTLVGPNGSGKSTLIRALIGLDRAEGQIWRRPGLRIGYVPQKLQIQAGLPITVRRFLSLPRRVGDDQAAAALARTGVAGLGGRQMAGLSGGQFQRVLLARALLARPDVLMLDEPTQGLDQPGVAGFYRLIEEVRAETGCAVLMVSHDLHVVMRATDRVLCLNGHICCQGTPEAVTDAPEYRALFGPRAEGALALYRHDHDHSHEGDHGHGHDSGHPHHLHGPDCQHHHHDHDHDHGANPAGAQAPGPLRQ